MQRVNRQLPQIIYSGSSSSVTAQVPILVRPRTGVPVARIAPIMMTPMARVVAPTHIPARVAPAHIATPIQPVRVTPEAPSKKINCIFFSSNCRECVTFIESVKSAGFIENFKLIDLDSRANQQFLRSVSMHPTVLVASLAKPYEGIRASAEWLDSARAFRTNQINNLSILQQRNSYLRSALEQGGPKGFHDKEMSANTDPYALVLIDNPLAQNFCYHGTEQVILSPPEESVIKKKDMKTLMAKIDVTRKQEESQFKDNADQYIHKIMSSSKKS